jgi:hypothetical protein
VEQSKQTSARMSDDHWVFCECDVGVVNNGYYGQYGFYRPSKEEWSDTGGGCCVRSGAVEVDVGGMILERVAVGDAS